MSTPVTLEQYQREMDAVRTQIRQLGETVNAWSEFRKDIQIIHIRLDARLDNIGQDLAAIRYLMKGQEQRLDKHTELLTDQAKSISGLASDVSDLKRTTEEMAGNIAAIAKKLGAA